MPFCTKCGKSIANDATFCSGCGVPVFRDNADIQPSHKSSPSQEYSRPEEKPSVSSNATKNLRPSFKEANPLSGFDCAKGRKLTALFEMAVGKLLGGTTRGMLLVVTTVGILLGRMLVSILEKLGPSSLAKNPALGKYFSNRRVQAIVGSVTIIAVVGFISSSSDSGCMLQARAGHTATLLANGKILVAGGDLGPDDHFKSLDSTEIFDPESGKSQYAASMNRPKENPSALLLKDGEVLITGGTFNEDRYAEVYDPRFGQLHGGR